MNLRIHQTDRKKLRVYPGKVLELIKVKYQFFLNMFFLNINN